MRKAAFMNAKKTIVTVLGADRTGIIARIATTLAKHGANIFDIRQTVLDDIFSMTMKVTLDEEVSTFNEVQEALEQDSKELGVQIMIQHEDVFKFMYEV